MDFSKLAKIPDNNHKVVYSDKKVVKKPSVIDSLINSKQFRVKLKSIHRVNDTSKTIENMQNINPLNKPNIQDLEQEVLSHGECIAQNILNLSLSNLLDAVSRALDFYSTEGLNEGQVMHLLCKGYDGVISTFDIVQNTESLRDSIIDTAVETLNLESEEDKSSESESNLLKTVGEALQSYANGDETLLKSLSLYSIEDPSEDQIDNLVEEYQSSKEDVLDSIKLINSVKNKVFDSETLKVLNKFNINVCVVSDSAHGTPFTESTSVIETPMTRDEFCSIYRVPGYVLTTATRETCPCVESVKLGSDIIGILPSNQAWIPVEGTAEDFSNYLNRIDSLDKIREEISLNCIPLHRAYESAAKYNELCFIDNRFYKTKLSNQCWHTDEDIEWLPGITSGTDIYPIWSNVYCPNTVDIYGTLYKY